MKTTVLLKDQTVGDTYEAVKEGDSIEVTLNDENGNQIKKRGIVIEILEESDY